MSSKQRQYFLPCEWDECILVFDSVNEYNTHVSNHIKDELSSAVAPYSCKWRMCSAVVGDDLKALVRHVLYHAFHSKIKDAGDRIKEAAELTLDCNGDMSACNTIPDIPEPFTCAWNDCNFSTDCTTSFYDHVAFHCLEYDDGKTLPERPKCLWGGCGHASRDRYDLSRHLHTHTQEKVAACSRCGAVVHDTTALLDHILRHHQTDENSKLKCPHCPRTFAYQRFLYDHVRQHVNHYKCPMCDMTCVSPAMIRRHITYRHTAERPYSCSYCNYRAKTQSDFRKHEAAHEQKHDQELYICDQEGCSYQCTGYLAMTKHHESEHKVKIKRLYQCHLCGVTCSRGSHLTRHLCTMHNFFRPSGHSRFIYKDIGNNIYRLQTIRYESIGLSKQNSSEKNVNTKNRTEDDERVIDYIEGSDHVSEQTQDPYVDDEQSEPADDIIMPTTCGSNTTVQQSQQPSSASTLPCISNIASVPRYQINTIDNSNLELLSTLATDLHHQKKCGDNKRKNKSPSENQKTSKKGKRRKKIGGNSLTQNPDSSSKTVSVDSPQKNNKKPRKRKPTAAEKQKIEEDLASRISMEFGYKPKKWLTNMPTVDELTQCNEADNSTRSTTMLLTSDELEQQLHRDMEALCDNNVVTDTSSLADTSGGMASEYPCTSAGTGDNSDIANYNSSRLQTSTGDQHSFRTSANASGLDPTSPYSTSSTTQSSPRKLVDISNNHFYAYDMFSPPETCGTTTSGDSMSYRDVGSNESTMMMMHEREVTGEL